MPLTVGGGIRTIDDIRGLLNAGADKVSINTAAVKDHEFVTKAAKRFGRQCIVVAIDAKRQQHPAIPRRGRCLSTAAGRQRGWMLSSGQRRWSRRGAGEILLTSMDFDGTKTVLTLR